MATANTAVQVTGIICGTVLLIATFWIWERD